MVPIDHAVGQSQVVIGLLILAIALSARRAHKTDRFPISVTQELKGLSILLVFFSHIGNFLIADHRFLSPLTGLSGVGVDMFLLLSGYGLSISNLHRPQKPKDFYKRLVKLFIPFWIVLGLFIAIDFIFLKQAYNAHFLARAFGGVFLRSDITSNLNAPFWFITVIAFYYLIFPLVFMKRHLWASALLVFGVGGAVVLIKPTILSYVMFLYQLHYVAFPLGMLLAWACYDETSAVRTKLNQLLASNRYQAMQSRLVNVSKTWRTVMLYSSMTALVILLRLINPHSHQSQGAIVEQGVDLLFVVALMLLFILKRADFRVLRILGVYSFEFYLLHWPIVSRYDQLYSRTPAWLATIFYIGIVLLLGYLLQRFSTSIWTWIEQRIKPRRPAAPMLATELSKSS